MKSVLFLLLGITTLFAARGQEAGIQFSQTSFTEAMQLAEKEQKIIFLDAFASWCGPCKKMDKEVFTRKDVGEFFNRNFVNLKIDMEKGEGKLLAERYEVKAYPTFLFIDQNGNLLHRSCGFQSGSDFLTTAHTALNSDTRISSLETAFKNNPTSAKAAEAYFSALQAGCGLSPGITNDYFENFSGEALQQPEFWDLVKRFASGANSVGFGLAFNNRESLSQIYGAQEINGFFASVLKRDLNVSAQRGDKEGFNNLVLQSQQLELDLGKTITEGRLTLMEKEGDWIAYARLSSEYVDTWNPGHLTLNNLAWNIVSNLPDNTFYLKNAKEWVEKSLSKEKAWFNLDTYGVILYQLGEFKQAEKALKKAIKLGTKAGEDMASSQAVLEKVKARK